MIVLLVSVAVVLGNYLAVIFFKIVEMVYETGDFYINFLFESQSITIYSFAPAGALFLIALAFLIEAQVLGWQKSSIRRALESESASSKIDWFYAILYASNLVLILSFFLLWV